MARWDDDIPQASTSQPPSNLNQCNDRIQASTPRRPTMMESLERQRTDLIQALQRIEEAIKLLRDRPDAEDIYRKLSAV